MSIRYKVTKENDIEVSEDGTEIEILYDKTYHGNCYIDVPITMITKILPMSECEWVGNDEYGEIIHETDCGESCYLGDDELEDRGFKFCPFCGRKIKVVNG
jgi:hypothetical protein